jgi:hypothetical protein
MLEDEVHPGRLALIGASAKSRVLYTVFAEVRPISQDGIATERRERAFG